MSEAAVDMLNDLKPMAYWVDIADGKVAKWERGEVEGYSTGFSTFDRNFRLVGSELTVIAAASSMGKTVLAMQMCENVAIQLKKSDDAGVVAIFSAEMSGWSLIVRMAGARAGINVQAARLGKVPADVLAKLRASIRGLDSLPIWIDDSDAPTTGTMIARMKSLSDVRPVRMMMFDFMELCGDKDSQSEEQRVGGIASALKGVAKVMEIPVVAISQINRNVENTTHKIPGMSDLRYSGTISHVADQVVTIMRPEYYLERGQECKVPDCDREGIAYINLAKIRNGAPTMEKMAFVKQHMKFADLKRIT